MLHGTVTPPTLTCNISTEICMFLLTNSKTMMILRNPYEDPAEGGRGSPRSTYTDGWGEPQDRSVPRGARSERGHRPASAAGACGRRLGERPYFARPAAARKTAYRQPDQSGAATGGRVLQSTGHRVRQSQLALRPASSGGVIAARRVSTRHPSVNLSGCAAGIRPVRGPASTPVRTSCDDPSDPRQAPDFSPLVHTTHGIS